MPQKDIIENKLFRKLTGRKITPVRVGFRTKIRMIVAAAEAAAKSASTVAA